MQKRSSRGIMIASLKLKIIDGKTLQELDNAA